MATNCHKFFFFEISETFALKIDRVPMLGPDAENQKCTQNVSSDFSNIGLSNLDLFPCFPLAFTRAKYPASIVVTRHKYLTTDQFTVKSHVSVVIYWPAQVGRGISLKCQPVEVVMGVLNPSTAQAVLEVAVSGGRAGPG